jgi:ribonuclease HII
MDLIWYPPMARASPPDLRYELAALARGFARVAGLDEVGRGPLAGPVFAAAVVLDPARIPAGLADSKALTALARRALVPLIMAVAEVSIGEASVEEIDRLNILRASHLAMLRALAGLAVPPDFALIDGNMIPRDFPCGAEAVVKGDARCLSIAAASIVAKVARDARMVDLAQHFPGYGWERNAGYPTKSHKAALLNLGVTPHHRRTFAPVHQILYQDNYITP